MMPPDWVTKKKETSSQNDPTFYWDILFIYTEESEVLDVQKSQGG